ncbi:MAG: winged helix-turn-helix transcriptional regulator [Hyphomicrobiales bacterium]|nr:winged helix-turn-helix transcriptional regulator [Hyphomicrobiales bacterium]
MRIVVLGAASGDLTAIEAALKRGEVEVVDSASSLSAPSEGGYIFAGWTLDVATRNLIRTEGGRVDLTSSEFDLLMAFLREPGRPLSRAALLRALRGRAWNYFDRSIDTLVARLRKKIDADRSGPPLIRSVRGVGYVFCASVLQARADRPAA